MYTTIRSSGMPSKPLLRITLKPLLPIILPNCDSEALNRHSKLRESFSLYAFNFELNALRFKKLFFSPFRKSSAYCVGSVFGCRWCTSNPAWLFFAFTIAGCSSMAAMRVWRPSADQSAFRFGKVISRSSCPFRGEAEKSISSFCSAPPSIFTRTFSFVL